MGRRRRVPSTQSHSRSVGRGCQGTRPSGGRRSKRARGSRSGPRHMSGAFGGRSLSRSSLAIAAFSTIVEWYDFTLYLYFATVLSRVFFGGGQQSLITTLAGFAIAYLMRPL